MKLQRNCVDILAVARTGTQANTHAMTISKYPTKKYLTVKNCNVENQKRCCSLYNKQIHLCCLFWFLGGSWGSRQRPQAWSGYQAAKQQFSTHDSLRHDDLGGGFFVPQKAPNPCKQQLESSKTREKHCLNLNHPLKKVLRKSNSFRSPPKIGVESFKVISPVSKVSTSRVQSLWHQTSLALP